MSSESLPSVFGKSSTREQSKEKRKAEESSIPQHIRETAKRLKPINEDGGLDFGPNPTDDRTLESQVKVAQSLRRKQVQEVLVDIRRARNVQLCFLVDVTSSMQPSIDGVRDSIKEIVRRLTAEAPRGANAESEAQSLALAFVAYRDFCDTNQFEVLPFTSNVTEFTDFCGRLRATGGGDGCEDVFGGLETALNLRWSENCGTKVIFHICDAPCHGWEFHRGGSDDYAAGDPKGRTCKGLFSRLRGGGIQYHFGKLTRYTELMIQKFAEAYGGPIVEFDVKNVAGIRNSVTTAVSKSISASVSATLPDV